MLLTSKGEITMSAITLGNSFALKCLGTAPGPGFQGFLDGVTQNATLHLSPSTEPPFTGTHWEVVDFGRMDTVNFDSGPLSTDIAIGGSAHIVMRNNGDFTVTSHAHDSGFDNIDYAISFVLMTPSGIAITFQHS